MSQTGLASLLNKPLPMEGRLTFLPAIVNQQGRQWGLPGVLAGAWNAFTAPGRALQGQQLGPEEALNVAGMTMLGGMPLPKPTGAGNIGLNVFHGSPHKFDKFDMSKVGTGEGAQAQGHGLYFAEAPATAKSYQQKLAGDGGALYKADLADSAVPKMLEWDKRFGEQPPAMQQTLESLLGTRPKDQATISSIYRDLAQRYETAAPGMPAGVTQPNPAMASQKLLEAGIPGIRYLDQGSRAGGTGTSNFVVFDDALLKILERR